MDADGTAPVRAWVEQDAHVLESLVAGVERVFRGKRATVQRVVVALLARGHVLLEDLPGVGKTTLARALARSIGCTFRRIQFTADLLPADVLGVSIYDDRTRTFVFRPGPIFGNVVLADELNRTTPRTQSALLEAMNEGQVTLDDQTRPIEPPFMVVATQNPKELAGTYPLPESQLDRFLMRLSIGYPDLEVESGIVRDRGYHDRVDAIEPVVSAADVVRVQQRVEHVHAEDKVIHYLMRIVEQTRESPRLDLGASTRAAIALFRAAQARAYLDGRDYVVPDDVKDLTVPVIAHRIWPTGHIDGGAARQEQAEAVLLDLLDTTPLPV